MTPADEYAETDVWPTPDRWTRHEAQTGLVPPPESTVTPELKWRDRGAIIATQQARIAELEATLDRASRDSITEARAYVALYARCEAADAVVEQLARECLDRESSERDCRSRLAVAEAKVERVEALAESSGDLDNGILVWDLRAALTGNCGCDTHPDRLLFEDGDPHGCYCNCADIGSGNCIHKEAS